MHPRLDEVVLAAGPEAAGKTTALPHVGRACHLARTQRTPTAWIGACPGAGRVRTGPARHERESPGHGVRSLLGIPVTARMTQSQITDAVCHTYNRGGVRLVVIDEIQRLNPRTTTGAESVDS